MAIRNYLFCGTAGGERRGEGGIRWRNGRRGVRCPMSDPGEAWADARLAGWWWSGWGAGYQLSVSVFSEAVRGISKVRGPRRAWSSWRC